MEHSIWSINGNGKKENSRKGDRERGSERGNNLNEIKKLKRDFQTNKFNKDFTVVHEFDFQIVCGP